MPHAFTNSGPLDATTAEFGSFVDAFDTLYPQYLHDTRESRTRDLTVMQVKQSGHEKVIPPNPDIVFRLVTGGKMTHSSVDLGDGHVALSGRTGSFYIAPPDAQAEWRSEGDHDLLMLSVAKERVHELLCDGDASPTDDPLRNLYGRDVFDSTLSRSLEKIWQEITAGGPGANLKVDGLFFTLLGTLAGLSEKGQASDKKRTTAKLDVARLSRVTDYIDAHFGQPISTQDLADVACLSLHHFTRAFAATTNVTPHRYVTNRRITASKDLLANRDLSLAQVAYMCGFASQSHFTTKFKAHLGVPPGTYRADLAA